MWSHFVEFVFTFLKQASSYFRCLWECRNSVFLWSSRNILGTIKLHLRQHEDGGDIDRVFVNWSRAKTKICESYFLCPLPSAHCFLLTGFTVWTRAKDVIWTSISQSWCNHSSTEDKLHWPCYFFTNTSYCVVTSHTSALAKYIFDAVADLCLIFWRFCCVQTDRPQLHWSLHQ